MADAAGKPAPAAADVDASSGATVPRGIRGVFQDPATRWLLISCFCYMIAFMWMQFLSAWTVEHITHSTRLVQFTGL